MKIGLLIPDRNDRPEFLANCLRMMKDQTLQPEIVELVNDPPKDDKIDITYRYRIGYDRLCNRGLDLIAFIENDDWYSPKYLEIHAKKWLDTGMPLILGTNYTIYYHLRMQKYYTMYHEQRSSSMNTFIRPNQIIDWPVDDQPYTDITLWEQLYKKGGLIWQPHIISVGMKHGIGKCGGFAHIDQLERYINDDSGFLHNTIQMEDEESFQFYTKFKNV